MMKQVQELKKEVGIDGIPTAVGLRRFISGLLAGETIRAAMVAATDAVEVARELDRANGMPQLACAAPEYWYNECTRDVEVIHYSNSGTRYLVVVHIGDTKYLVKATREWDPEDTTPASADDPNWVTI